MLLEILGFLLFLIILQYYWVEYCKNKQIGIIPKVSKIPFIGCLLVLTSFQPDNLHIKFKEFVSRFGKTFRANVFNVLVVVTCDARYIEPILNSQQHIRKHVVYKLLRSWLGDGLLLSSGQKWQSMRKIITPTFHFKILEQFVEVFDKQSTILIEHLEEYADGKTIIDIYPHIGLLTLDIITETAMGVYINAQTNSKSEVVQAVKDVTNILATRFVKPFLSYPLLFKLLRGDLYKKQINGIKTLHEFTDKIIEERRLTLREKVDTLEIRCDEEECGIKRRMALLDVLLQSTTDEKQSLSDEQIRDEVNTFIFEGHDTTTTATSFCLYLISRHAHCQQKLFEEISAYFGDDLDRPILYSDLQNLTYLNCVIKESLRLYPPIPAIGRWLKEDLSLDDVTLPAGTNVIVLLWQLLRDPTTFPEPESFNPERHFDDKSHHNIFSNIPFSAGPRNCIGQRFALFEMKTIVVKMLRNYELLPLGDEIQPSIKIVLRSKSGVNFGIQRRHY